jgi:hypothetical protein
MQNVDHNIGFWEKRQFFRRKLSKIAENCDHNIDPRVTRLGDCLDSFWNVKEVFRIFLQLFFHSNGFVLISNKESVVKHLGDFARTHLVTMKRTKYCADMNYTNLPSRSWSQCQCYDLRQNAAKNWRFFV